MAEIGIVAAFTPDQVERLTGLSARQLAYWDRTGFFAPQHAAADRRSRFARLYSFRDVVGLRVLHRLRNGHGVPLPHLREVARRLSGGDTAFWATTRMKVWQRRVQFEDPEGRIEDALNGQGVLFPLEDVAREVGDAVAALRRRDPATVGRIERDRSILRNAAVIAGTRVPVAAVRRFLETGASPAAILAEYPVLTEADIAAVVRSEAPLAA